MAQGAGVPLQLGFLDYTKKCGGFGPIIVPTGLAEQLFKPPKPPE